MTTSKTTVKTELGPITDVGQKVLSIYDETLFQTGFIPGMVNEYAGTMRRAMESYRTLPQRAMAMSPRFSLGVGDIKTPPMYSPKQTGFMGELLSGGIEGEMKAATGLMKPFWDQLANIYAMEQGLRAKSGTQISTHKPSFLESFGDVIDIIGKGATAAGGIKAL